MHLNLMDGKLSKKRKHLTAKLKTTQDYIDFCNEDFTKEILSDDSKYTDRGTSSTSKQSLSQPQVK